MDKKSDAWNLPPTIRGLVIEELLANDKDEYGSWTHCGAERGGYYPVIDFIKDPEVVSLKTIDLNLTSYQGNGGTRQVLKLIREYNSRELPVEGDYSRILDIRVPEGTKGNLDMQKILEAADEAGIDIRVKEF